MVREILAIEVTAAAVRGLRLGGLGRGRTVRAYAERPLPPGCLVPSPAVPNVRDEAAFRRALSEIVGRRPPGRARLVLPDRSVRLRVLSTDARPDGEEDLRGLLLWRLKDVPPFPPEEARLAYLTAPNGLPTRRVTITLLARAPVLAQYEHLLGSLGVALVHAAPAACHLFNWAAPAAGAFGEAVQALLALGPDSATLILSQRGIPHYARTFLCAGPAPPPATGSEHLRWVRALGAEVLRSFTHAAETVGMSPPARLAVAGELGPYASLAPLLAGILGLPCTTPAPPTGFGRKGRPLPPEAGAVFTAALARTC